MRYAIVENGTVVNIAVATRVTHAPKSRTQTVVPIESGVFAAIGIQYDGTTFINPETNNEEASR